jgi:hypothetical protein
MTPPAANPITPAAVTPAVVQTDPASPHANQFPGSGLPGSGWYGKKLIVLIALALGVHLGLIWFFGNKNRIVPRQVSHVPRLQLANDQNQLIALEDPTLFALPNQKDFSSVTWSAIPVVAEPSFQWNESPRWLAPETNSPETVFKAFTRAPAPLGMAPEAKPPPVMTGTPAQMGGAMPDASSLEILGDLTGRGLLSTVDLPSLPYDNVIPASRVQVLVDPAGDVVSAVLLPPTDSTEAVERCDAADQQALVIARGLRFAPGSQLNVGELDFCWHATPVRLNHDPTGF